MKYRYVITGTDKQGKQIEPIYTSTPQCYNNIYRCTIWRLDSNNKRHKIYSVWN